MVQGGSEIALGYALRDDVHKAQESVKASLEHPGEDAWISAVASNGLWRSDRYYILAFNRSIGYNIHVKSEGNRQR